MVRSQQQLSQKQLSQKQSSTLNLSRHLSPSQSQCRRLRSPRLLQLHQLWKNST